MIVFYSGYGCDTSDPELFFPRRRQTYNVMLTYYDSHKKEVPHKRLRRILRHRRRGKVE